MTLNSLYLQIQKLKKKFQKQNPVMVEHPVIQRLRDNPSTIFTAAGLQPDQWQEDILSGSDARIMLLCSRQAGKSQTAAGIALHTALTQPNSLILLLSPTERQSGELFRDKVLKLYSGLGKPVPAIRESALQMDLANGSRIVSLPGKEGNIRGYSGAKLLVLDEAARVPDDLYKAVRPMLAVSKGRLMGLSSAWAKQGWFYEEWCKDDGPWKKVKVTAYDCQRIPAEFLAEERLSLGERWYGMEYECKFSDAIAGLFSGADIEAACDDEVQPLVLRR